MMLFLYVMSLVSLVIQAVFVTLCIAAGLYYLSELVEEYTVMTKVIVSWAVAITVLIHIGLMIFEEVPWHLNALGLAQQALHALMLKEYPALRAGPACLTAVVTLVVHHYCAFTYFGNAHQYSFSEVLAYFTLCLWAVPFALFVSLSANDYVLPTASERQPLLGDNNVVTDYLARNAKRFSPLALFARAPDAVLPKTKKTF